MELTRQGGCWVFLFLKFLKSPSKKLQAKAKIHRRCGESSAKLYDGFSKSSQYQQRSYTKPEGREW
jgi:hypothetical protein